MSSIDARQVFVAQGDGPRSPRAAAAASTSSSVARSRRSLSHRPHGETGPDGHGLVGSARRFARRLGTSAAAARRSRTRDAAGPRARRSPRRRRGRGPACTGAGRYRAGARRAGPSARDRGAVEQRFQRVTDRDEPSERPYASSVANAASRPTAVPARARDEREVRVRPRRSPVAPRRTRRCAPKRERSPSRSPGAGRWPFTKPRAHPRAPGRRELRAVGTQRRRSRRRTLLSIPDDRARFPGGEHVPSIEDLQVLAAERRRGPRLGQARGSGSRGRGRRFDQAEDPLLGPQDRREGRQRVVLVGVPPLRSRTGRSTRRDRPRRPRRVAPERPRVVVGIDGLATLQDDRPGVHPLVHHDRRDAGLLEAEQQRGLVRLASRATGRARSAGSPARSSAGRGRLRSSSPRRARAGRARWTRAEPCRLRSHGLGARRAATSSRAASATAVGRGLAPWPAVSAPAVASHREHVCTEPASARATTASTTDRCRGT